MRVSDLWHGHADGEARISCELRGAAGSRRLWFSASAPDGTADDTLIRDRADPFVAPALLLAMEAGEDLVIDAPVSERIAHGLDDLAAVIAILLGLGSVPKIEIGAIAPSRTPAPGVATGFSCGIDSLHALHELFVNPGHGRRRLSHLLFFDVGSHGRRDAPRVSAERRERVGRVARELGLPLITLRSNLDQLTATSFAPTHTLRNASAAHALSGRIGCFFYASAWTYRDVGVRRSATMGIADPVVLGLLSTDALTCIPLGTRLRRVDKTALVADLPIAQRALDVCTDDSERVPGGPLNCSRCQKCRRTLLTLDILGRVAKFEAVFDLGRYRADRSKIVAGILAAPDGYEREIIALARERKVDLGAMVDPVSRLRAFPKWLRRRVAWRV